MSDDRSLMWSGPGRALDAHLDLFHYVDGARKFMIGRSGKKTPLHSYPFTLLQRLNLMTSFADTKMELQLDGQSVAARPDDFRQFNSPYNIERTAGLIRQEYEILNNGETHYVSHHVMSTLETAIETMDDEPLFPTDLPAPTGLIVFEYPLLLPDLHPDTGELVPELLMPLRAVGWTEHPVHVRNAETGELSRIGGIHYVLYTDEDSFRKIFADRSVRKVLGDEVAERYLNDPMPLRLWSTDSTAWAYGMKWQTGYDVDSPFGSGMIHPNVAALRRWLLAYFRWTWDRILIPERYTPRKHERRRAERLGKKFEDGHIKILRLRREVEAERRARDGDGEGFFYTHQWIVRGHWRRVHYRTLGPARNEDGSFNRDSHRLKWIEPHLSGNPIGPLKVGHNVTAAVR